jgi:hypothetical protein
MEAVARSQGASMAWNQQIILGSPIRMRTRGADAAATGFSGYRVGANRSGSNLDIVAELRSPQTLGGRRYDTLVLTERHDIVNTLMWEDTVRYTRHFHDRLIAGNSAGQTYLYHSWLPVNDRANPWPWLAYERTAARAWQCVAARVNVSLGAAGRSDRVTYLPAALALADLVEQALRGAVPGVSAGDAGTVIDRIFTDRVHTTALGEYYMALVTYAAVYRRSPQGAWAPSGISAEQASVLQNLAWQSVSNHYATATTPSLDQCQAAMREQVCTAYGNYSGNGGAGAGCGARFTDTTQNNPFRYNANTDASYWLPPP